MLFFSSVKSTFFLFSYELSPVQFSKVLVLSFCNTLQSFYKGKKKKKKDNAITLEEVIEIRNKTPPHKPNTFIFV